MKPGKLSKYALIMGLWGSSIAVVPNLDTHFATVAHAAEEAPPKLTKAQAMQIVKAVPLDMTGYELDEPFQDERLSFEQGSAVWTLGWRKGEDGNQLRWMTVEASTGKLLRYSQYEGNPAASAAVAGPTISREEALQKARQFLAAVAPAELAHTAGPDQYESLDPFPPRAGVYSFSFTRVEQGIPFLENDLQVTVDVQGEIEAYVRNWFDGPLPAPVPKLSAAEAAKRWQEAIQPTLGYVYAGEAMEKYGLKRKRTMLAYFYSEKDPVLIEAMTGQPLNRLGEVASHQEPKPLGASTRGVPSPQAELKEDELRDKADEIARTLFGAEPDRQKTGESLFISMNDFGEGSSANSSLYFYVRPGDGEEDEKHYSLGLDAYGNITSFSREEAEEDEGEVEQEETANAKAAESRAVASRPISYEQAEAAATAFVKKLFADRLGELYPIHLPPTEESKAYLLRQSNEYNIVFGWLKEGIPVESVETEVAVDAGTGEVKGLFTLPFNQELAEIPKQSPAIDGQRAKQAEAEHRKLLLTYFLPHPEWRQGGYLVKREPRLAYRMTGDDGVVDAQSGKWVSFTAYRQSKIPEDISSHPQLAALLHAVEEGYFSVSDRKLEPQQLVTRGELLRILVQANRAGGYQDWHGEEGETAPAFADIGTSHPLYQTVQEAVAIGLVQPAAGGRELLPDRPVSRQEASELAARLLAPEQANVFPGKAGAAGKPGDFLTRADAAALLLELEAAADGLRAP